MDSVGAATMPDTVDLSIFLNCLADPGKHAGGLVGIPSHPDLQPAATVQVHGEAVAVERDCPAVFRYAQELMQGVGKSLSSESEAGRALRRHFDLRQQQPQLRVVSALRFRHQIIEAAGAHFLEFGIVEAIA